MLDTLNVVVWLLEKFLKAWKIKFSLKKGTFWRVWPVYSETSKLQKIPFSHFYANIFSSTCCMVFIFSPVDRYMLEKHVRYLERDCMTFRNFLKSWKIKFFLKKCTFWRVWSFRIYSSNPSKSAFFQEKLDFQCL